jgi:hypothetical protein
MCSPRSNKWVWLKCQSTYLAYLRPWVPPQYKGGRKGGDQRWGEMEWEGGEGEETISSQQMEPDLCI